MFCVQCDKRLKKKKKKKKRSSNAKNENESNISINVNGNNIKNIVSAQTHKCSKQMRKIEKSEEIDKKCVCIQRASEEFPNTKD